MSARGTVPGLEVDGTCLRLSGGLTVTTVSALLPEGRRALAALAGGEAILDLAQVSSCDSSGLALVVDWLRSARHLRVDLGVRSAPEQLRAMAQVSGLSELLGTGEDNAS